MLKEYQNKSNTQNEFAYDANGNMTKDLDRDIVAIRYNLLNLPDIVQFKNGKLGLRVLAAYILAMTSVSIGKSKSR